jgi:hypothetical protein
MSRPRLRLRSEHLVLAASLALLLAATLLFGRAPVTGADPDDVYQGSTHFTSPSGGRAFHDLLAELDVKPLRHQKTSDAVPRDVGTLLLIAPGHAPDGKEIEALAGWVQDGGTLVWIAGRKTTPAAADALLKPFGLASEARTGAAVATTGRLSPWGDGPRRYALRCGGPISIAAPPDPAQILIQDPAGAVAGVAVPKGRGRFVALTELDLVSNGGLRTEDHAEFMVHLALLSAGPRRIAFDEYHHGFRDHDSPASLLLESPLGAAAGLLLVAGFAAVYAHRRRLGPPVDTHDERRRRPGEAFDAFAGAAGRLRAAPAAMALILAEFEAFLERQLGVSRLPQADHAAVRAGLAPGELAEALEAARAVAVSRADEPALIHVSRRLEELRRRLVARRAKERRAT